MPDTFASPISSKQMPEQNLEARLSAIEQSLSRQQSADTSFSSLDQVGNDLGSFQVGELIVGTGTPENGDLTGIAILYPPMTISGADWNLVGMNNGVLEVGINAADGKLYAGAGNIVMDATAITLTAGVYPSSSFINWKTQEVTPVLVGQIVASYAGALTNSGLLINGIAHDAGVSGLVELAAYDNTPTFRAGLIIDSRGTVVMNLEGGTLVAAGQQSLSVQTKINVANATNSVLYLDTKTTANGGNAQVGMGTGLNLRAVNGAGTMLTIGNIFANYSVVTAGAETSAINITTYSSGFTVSGQLWPSPVFPGSLTVANQVSNLASARSGRVTLATDTVTIFNTASTDGLIIVGSGNAQGYVYAVWNSSSGLMSAFIIGTATVTGTGILTNGTTDGVATKLNVNAATNGNLYIKNRTGVTLAVFWLCI